MKLCPFCGADMPCTAPKCSEARARVPLATKDTHGIPNTRKRDREHERTRPIMQIRVLRGIHDRIRAAAAREGITQTEFVERWALSLPDPEPKP